ncbi:MAG: cell division protein FtsZ [Euryarchaeota archaeon]|nr:cell division protein FtsZ [Euryarchaeota archaeon]
MIENVVSGEAGPSPEAADPVIVVTGIGGAGCNFVHRITLAGVRGVTTVAVNTDRMHLEMVDADKKLLIGNDRVHGTGCGSDPELGRLCMADASEVLAEQIGSPDVVFIVTGLGGGTGTGGAPAAARIAKATGAIVVGVAFMPFRSERTRRAIARGGLEEFRRSSDAVMVMENDRLLTLAPDLPIGEAFSMMDRLIAERISGVLEMMSLSTKLVETSRLLEALPEQGMAMLSCGEAITCEAVDHPLLELECAAGAAASGPGARTLAELWVEEARQGTLHMPQTNVLVGTRNDPGGKRVVPIAAGLPVLAAGPPDRAPTPSRGGRQTVLLSGPWTI